MAILGLDNSVPFQWLEEGLGHARRVGRIQLGDQPLGSGFLLDGHMIGDWLDGPPVFLTGDFVLTRNPRVGLKTNELRWRECTVVFEEVGESRSNLTEHRIEALLAHEPSLNFAAVLLEEPPECPRELAIAPSPPSEDRPVYVVSYPRGGGLKVTLQDNQCVGLEAPHLLYRAPTEPGSSGGPVFNEYWELAAMHIGVWQKEQPPRANFGVVVGKLLETLRVTLQDSGSALDQYRSASPTVRYSAPRSAARPAEPVETPEHLDYYSAFLSYSHDDKLFAARLFKELRSLGIAVWWDQVRMRVGDDIYARINEMRKTDKVILCCSKSSLKSLWVDNELKLALEKERDLRTKHEKSVSVVLPLDLDGYLQEWAGPMSAQFVSRNYADFTGWQDDTKKFEEGVKSIARALQVEINDSFPEPKLF